MNNQQLLRIRQQILDTSLPLILEGNGVPEERFDILLRFMRLNVASRSSALYEKAYETAQSFEDPSERLDALLRLLSEVDAEIDSRPEVSDTEPVIQEAAPQEVLAQEVPAAAPSYTQPPERETVDN